MEGGGNESGREKEGERGIEEGKVIVGENRGGDGNMDRGDPCEGHETVCPTNWPRVLSLL
jgi:hypothetical protein